MVRALLVSLLAALALPVTAHAGWKIDRSLAIADIRWGAAPCGPVAVIRDAWLPSFRESHALAVADKDDCRVYLRPDWTPDGFGDLCTVILHERGHIDGYRDPSNLEDPEHSRDPNNIMAADYLLVTGFLRVHGRRIEAPESGNSRCWYRGRRYIFRHLDRLLAATAKYAEGPAAR